MTIQPGQHEQRSDNERLGDNQGLGEHGQHHQAGGTQELVDAADQIHQRQQERYGQDPATDEFPAAAPAFRNEHSSNQQQAGAPQFGHQEHSPEGSAAGAQRDFADQDGLTEQPAGFPGQSQEFAAEDVTDVRDERSVATDRDASVHDTSTRDADDAVAQDTVAQNVAQDRVTQDEPVQGEPVAGRPTATTEEEHVSLFDRGEADGLRTKWRDIQSDFVDDPQHAVQGADQLVAQVIQSLTASFAAHKKELDAQWQGGNDVATEDLRLALRRYRTLFNQLLDA